MLRETSSCNTPFSATKPATTSPLARTPRDQPPTGTAGWPTAALSGKPACFVSGAGFLPPDTGTSVQVANDKRTVHDGPYADSKEQLGGFYVIEVSDLDAALAWAAKCPSSSGGTTEVRPLLAPRRGSD